MKLVSVIIPTFNRAAKVVKAIESVIDQTYKNIEIVVVDDGSTDQTATAVTRFGDNVKYLSKKNGGVSSARNYGIKNCAGDLIAFLDSDDLWLPHKILKQVDYLQQHSDFGMVLCDYFIVNPEGKQTGTTNRRDDLPNDGMILHDVLLAPYLIPSSVLVRKDVLIEVGMFDETLKTAEDLDLHLKIACKYKIGLLCEPLLKYMSGHESLSMLTSTYDDHVYVFERFASECTDNVDRPSLEQALFKSYIAAANGKYWQGKWTSGAVYTIKLSKKVNMKNIYKILIMWLKSIKYFILIYIKKWFKTMILIDNF